LPIDIEQAGYSIGNANEYKYPEHGKCLAIDVLGIVNRLDDRHIYQAVYRHRGDQKAQYKSSDKLKLGHSG